MTGSFANLEEKMKNIRIQTTPARLRNKLHLNRETLRLLNDQELQKVAAGNHTRGAHCFSDPSLCATCLCTR